MQKTTLLFFLFLFSSDFLHSQCFKEISCGQYHTTAIKPDGTLWAWGKNNSGELGDSTYITKSRPIQIGKANDWSTVSSGVDFTLAIKTDGTMWGWGTNISGQQGKGNTTPSTYPVMVGVQTNWSKVFTKLNRSFAIKKDGTLWACGAGMLGNGTNSTTNSWIQIGNDTIWSSVGMGSSSCAIKKNGTIWTWGKNGGGQLGDGTNIDRLYPNQVGTSNNWISISMGDSYTMAMKNDSTLWAWGSNQYGQLGINTLVNSSFPVQVGTANDWKLIYTGAFHCTAIKKDSSLWNWGWNYLSQLGDGTGTEKLVPTRSGAAYKWLFCATSTSSSNIAERADGSLWSWGSNDNGQLGIGTIGVSKSRPIYLACPISIDLSNKIRGSVFTAINNNCYLDAGEIGIPSILFTATSSTKAAAYYGISDINGKYVIYTDSGNYEIKPVYSEYFKLLLKNLYCPASATYNLKFDGFKKDTGSFNFAQEVALEPFLYIDIAMNRQRRCFDNAAVIKYCNLGTRDTDNVKIIVELPPDISYTSASKTPVINGKKLIFNIGSLKAGECGTISLITKVNCVNGILDQTRCYKLAITPVNTTYKNRVKKQGYDNSKISTSVNCSSNNRINFEIINRGDDMSDSSVYRIYQDALLGYSSKFKLKAGDSQMVSINATGHTYRIEADQNIFYPGYSNPNSSIEDCGSNTSSHWGTITKLPPFEENVEYKEHCVIIVGSNDPNEKSVIPKGTGTGNTVKHKVPLKYTIDFQNTGTDTAYTVIVRDTLSKSFDIGSFIAGPSTHRYHLKFSGVENPVLNFVFDTILLVDSTTNEKGSHGFVSYSIMPYDSVPDGTVIKNSADIYFDFNEPVRTNTVSQTIDDRLPTTTTPLEILLPPIAPTWISSSIDSNKYVKLQWKDNSNNETQFRIYNSADPNGPFIQIDSVMANKTSYTHLNSKIGMQFYKICATNNEGQNCTNTDSLLLSSSTAISFSNSTTPAFSIYPNPFQNSILIKSYSQLINEIIITNLMGEIILFQEVHDQTSMNISSSFISPGIYFLKIRNKDMQVKVYKIVK